MQLLRGRTESIKHLSISCDGRYLMAGTTFRHVWDLHEPKSKPRVVSAGEANDWDLDVQFLTATQVLIKTVRTPGWFRHDLETGVTTDLMRPPELLRDQVRVHPSGETVKVVAHLQSYDLELWTYRVWKARLDLIETNPAPIRRLCGFTPNGASYLAATFVPGSTGLTYDLHDTVTDSVTATFEQALGNGFKTDGTWCFSPDGGRLFVPGCKLLRYECSTGGLPALAADWPSIDYPQHHPRIAAHPDGHILATVEDGRVVTFRDADTLEVLRRYDFAMPTVTCVAFTPDGTRCVIGNSRGKVLLFDVG